MNKRWLVLSILVGLVFMLPTPALADFQAGLDAYNRGDYDTARREFRPLAEQGEAESQLALGLMYSTGEGVPQDDQEAVRWFRQAAGQGIGEAQYILGSMYLQGLGVVQDYGEAAQWYRRAAEQGNAAAQYNLGEMYALGRGVPHNYIQGYMWNSLAAAQGLKIAIRDQYVLESFITPEQLAEAQRLAREWTPKGK